MRLKAGDVLPSELSPDVGDRGLTVTVKIERPEGDGVLAAQGGVAHGYSLYVRDGRLGFDVRRNGTLKTVTAGEPLGDGPATVQAVLGKDGSVRLLARDKEVGFQEEVGMLSRTPADGLSAGHDSGDPVGGYEAPFKYQGDLGTVVVQSTDSPKAARRRR